MRPALRRAAQACLLFGVEQQEPAAAAPISLPPMAPFASVVPGVDVRVGHRAERFFLCSQCSCMIRPNAAQVSGLDRLQAAVAQLPHAVEIVDHLLVVALLRSSCSLSTDDAAR